MSKYMDRAIELRMDTTRHYNCAQSVFIPFAEDKGLDAETAFAIAQHYGAGMRMASTCGAFTGGLMALGLYGTEEPSIVKEFANRLKEKHEGHLDCASLLKISKEKGEDKKAHCDNLVYECIEIVEDILKEKGILA